MNRLRHQRGFSIYELLVTLVVISAVMAVAVKGIMDMQQRSTAEASKTDTVQETRDFIDQIVRDMHDTGYPPPRAMSYSSGGWNATDIPLCMIVVGGVNTINTNVRNSSNAACGIISFTTTTVVYEGDMGDSSTVPNVSEILLDIVPTSGTTCPCVLRRGTLAKSTWIANNCDTNPTSSSCTPQYFTEVNGVLNTGNGAGASTYGLTLGGGSTYTQYTTQDVFDAYDTGGTLITSCTLTSNPSCTAIRSIQISANVAPSFADPTEKTYPVFSITSKGRLNF